MAQERADAPGASPKVELPPSPSPSTAAPPNPDAAVPPGVLPTWPTAAAGESPPHVLNLSAENYRSVSRPRRIPAYVTGGLAIVALGAGVVLGALAVSDHSQFERNPTAATANRGESRELAADMLFGGAATLAVASVVIFFARDPDESAPARPPVDAPRMTVAPVVSPHGASLGAVIHF
jgi:hypothetical protein